MACVHSTRGPGLRPRQPAALASRRQLWSTRAEFRLGAISKHPTRPPRLLSPAVLFTRTSSWPRLIMPLHLGGTSLKPFLGFPSSLLVSATADSLDSLVQQAAEPQTVRGTGPCQVLGEVGTECRGGSTRTRAVLSSCETSVVDPASTGGSLLLSSPLYVILRILLSPSTKTFPPGGGIWSTFPAFGSRLRVKDG